MAIVLAVISVCATSLAQPRPQAPDSDYLFLEDKLKKDKKDKTSLEAEAMRKKKKEFAAIEKTGKLPFDVNAKQIRFDSSGNKILADGGLVITYSSMVLEAVKGVVDLTTNEAQVSGDVRISDLSGTITADSAHFNLNTGTGLMENADVYLSAGEFQLRAKEIGKEAGDIYTLKDGTLTTCECAEGKDCPPWRIRANEARIERNGYGEAWGAKLDVLNVPVFYTPYLIFPAKTERQTGLLPFTIGRGRESGFDLRTPFFWNINDSTDMTLTGIYESNIRVGLDTEFRKVFSRKSELEGGLIYLNESERDGALLGTDTTDMSDPTLDENRFAGYVNEDWRGNLGDIPLQLVTRGRYVSDDLFVREYENDKIAKYNARFVTSRMTFRAPISSAFSLDMMGEFNQALVEDDDYVLQRLPEVEATGLQVFRPFGENPLGLKMVSETTLSAANFTREKSYDGVRGELYQSFRFPFHVRNYVEAQLDGNVRATQYELDETIDTGIGTSTLNEPGVLESSTNRVVPGLSGKMNTVLERVYDLDESNPLRIIGELGPLGRNQQLARVKHTIEPGIRWKVVPSVDQEDTPIFDTTDHLAQRNVATYSLTQRLFGRYEPRNTFLYGIEEATPDVGDLGNLRATTPIDDALAFGFQGDDDVDFQRLRTGSLRELVTFKLSQSYDFLDPEEDFDTQEVNQYSDVSADLILYPNDYVYFRGKSDFDPADTSFNSYLLESQLEDKRGDRIRLRLRSIDTDSPVRQLEGNFELRVTDSVRLGYYTRYDDLEGEIIEQKLGMRYLSQCNCWIFDVDFTDRINPDETKVTFNVTLVGLGELNQSFFPVFNDRRDQRNRGSNF